jgi:hypothetical protein
MDGLPDEPAAGACSGCDGASSDCDAGASVGAAGLRAHAAAASTAAHATHFVRSEIMGRPPFGVAHRKLTAMCGVANEAEMRQLRETTVTACGTRFGARNAV